MRVKADEENLKSRHKDSQNIPLMLHIKMAMLLMIMLIASTSGLPPLHDIKMDAQSDGIGPGSIRQYAKSLRLPGPKTSGAIQPSPIVAQNHSPQLMSSPLVQDFEIPGITVRPLETEMAESGRHTLLGEETEPVNPGPRHTRAAALRIPALRIPFLTRARPKVSVPRSPGARSPSPSVPKTGPSPGAGSTSKRGSSLASSGSGRAPEPSAGGGPINGQSGAGAPRPGDKTRRSNKGSLPDLDDLPNIGDLSDFLGSGSSEKDSQKPKDEDETDKATSSASSTTERNPPKPDGPPVHHKGNFQPKGPEHSHHKGAGHFHPEGPGHFHPEGPGNFHPGNPGHFHPKGPGHFHPDGPVIFPDHDWHGW